jgi:hypothetical protein
MQHFDVLKDGPFRYIHSTEDCRLLMVLVRQSDGLFVEEEGEGRPVAHTLRQWKAILRHYGR